MAGGQHPKRPPPDALMINLQQLQHSGDSSSSQAGDSRLRVPNDPPSSQTGNPKVAIPRAPGSFEQSNTNKRVGHACESCREQKTKCSGDRPVCQRCQELGLTCLYGDRKRERTAKQLRDYANQVYEYEQLLNSLHPKLGPQDVQTIQDTLAKYRFDTDKSTSDDISASFTRSGPSDSSDYTPTLGRPALSVLGGADYTEEDFNRSDQSKALGFVGKHSETAWLYNLKREIESNTGDADQTETNLLEDHHGRHSIASATYFLDDTEIMINEDIDPLGRPSRVVANGLVQTFFNTVHTDLPIIAKEIFLGQLNTFYTAPFARPGRKWLAILNLVFAIASRSDHHQIQNTLLDVGEETLQYFSRSWKLGMKDTCLLDRPDLQQVQIEGLTSFFLLSLGHTNRAWRICGLAIRSATAMGLNLRSESNYVTLASRESRYKVWWSLYTLETLLGIMLGRPISVEKEFCTTPFPVPFEEQDFSDAKVIQVMSDNRLRNNLLGHVLAGPISDASPALTRQSIRTAKELLSPNHVLYFVCFVDISRLIRQVIETLYAPGVSQHLPTDPEIVITDLNIKADVWVSKLPSAFRFTDEKRDTNRDYRCLRLGIQYYSTKILIGKPCLQSLDLSPAGDDRFYEKTADGCVEAACKMLDLFPAVFDATWLTEVAPWWSVLHYLVQATTVLLIRASAIADSTRSQKVRHALDKAARWLSGMSLKDLASQRAYTVCASLLEQLGPMTGEGGTEIGV